MTTAATPSPPPPAATVPPLPRRSSTCDGSSRAPGRNLTPPSLQIPHGERGDSRHEDENEVNDRPREQRCARLVRTAERAELDHVLGEAGRVDREPVQGVFVERIERQHPRSEMRDVLQALR